MSETTTPLHSFPVTPGFGVSSRVHDSCGGLQGAAQNLVNDLSAAKGHPSPKPGTLVYGTA